MFSLITQKFNPMNITIFIIISLVSGFIGTLVMTTTQFLEITISKRQSSFTPAIAVSRVLGINLERLSYRHKTVLNYVAHFGYGTAWGIPLLIATFLSLDTFLSIVWWYFMLVWFQGFIIAPLFAQTSWPWRWGLKNILIDGIHKVIYSTSVVSVYLWLT